MALVAINCAAPKYRKAHISHEVSLEDCLSCAATRENPCHFTYELLASMFAQQQDRDYISTTVLTGKCLRQTFLERNTDFAQDPEKLYPSFRGTMYHGQLEAFAHPDAVEEPRYHVYLEDLGWLSGSPDLLDTAKGKLYDYKTSKEVPKYGYPWSNHGDQMNVNRWLVDHAEYVTWRGEEYELRPNADTMKSLSPEDQAEYLDGILANRNKFIPKEWTELILVYMDNETAKPLPVTKSVQVPKKSGDGTKAQRVPDIWDDDFAENWIRTRYAAAKAALEGGELPDIPDDMQGWDHPICKDWCPHRQTCMDLHYGAAEVPVLLGKKTA